MGTIPQAIQLVVIISNKINILPEFLDLFFSLLLFFHSKQFIGPLFSDDDKTDGEREKYHNGEKQFGDQQLTFGGS